MRCRGRYVYDVMGSLGGRGLRPGNGGRGGCFWSVCVWGGCRPLGLVSRDLAVMR